MKKFFLTLIALLFALLSEPAFADWVTFSAAAKCDVKRGIFSLAPVVETSSEEYNIPASLGYVAFGEKENQNLMCKLNGLNIKLIISVWGPSATGMGQGAGVVMIENLSIEGRRVFPYRTNFLWRVSNERVLTRIDVQRIKQGYEIQYCYSDGFSWDIEMPFENLKCGASIETE